MEVMKYLDYIIAIFTTLFAVAGMQFKNMKIIIVSQLAANALLGLQCLLGGTASAGATVVVALLQTSLSFVFTVRKKEFPVWLTLVFMGLFVAINVIWYSTPFDILVLVAACFFAAAIVQKRSWICRIYSFINTLLWLIYDIAVMPSGIINHSVILVFIFVGIVRLDIPEWTGLVRRILGKKNASDTVEEIETKN